MKSVCSYLTYEEIKALVELQSMENIIVRIQIKYLDFYYLQLKIKK